MKVKTVCIEITNQCNLNCSTCFNRSGLNCYSKEISPDQIRHIIDLFSHYCIQNILISGGEPTLHSKFNEILDLHKVYPNILFGVLTNGTVYNKKFIDTVNSSENLMLQVSLDGSDEEHNSKTRGKNNFRKTIDFVSAIHNPNITKLLKMVISQYNYDDIASFYSLAISLGFTPEFAFIFRSGNGAIGWDDKDLCAEEKIKANKLIEKLNRQYHIQSVIPICTSKCPHVSETKEDLSLSIKIDGSIQPCQILYDDIFSLGNVFDFNEKLFIERLNYISKLARARLETDYGCDRCIVKRCCGRGCMASAFCLTGNPLSDDGDCHLRKTQFVESLLKEHIANNAIRV